MDTVEIVAVNAAVVAPAGTIAEVGTATAPLLLARLTAWPLPLAAEDKITVQLSAAGPAMGFVAQFKLLILTIYRC